MDTISYTAARNRLAKTMDQVNDDHAPVLITRQRGKPAVLISLDDFNAYEETAYLLRSPVNAGRLRSAVRQLRAGKGRARKLVR
ncbi:MAG: type II toxin-antitoxin system Phd/YefM family antitoxin [Burkholderiales bacterium]